MRDGMRHQWAVFPCSCMWKPLSSCRELSLASKSENIRADSMTQVTDRKVGNVIYLLLFQETQSHVPELGLLPRVNRRKGPVCPSAEQKRWKVSARDCPSTTLIFVTSFREFIAGPSICPGSHHCGVIYIDRQAGTQARFNAGLLKMEEQLLRIEGKLWIQPASRTLNSVCQGDG
jgi:hypothetical protein